MADGGDCPLLVRAERRAIRWAGALPLPVPLRDEGLQRLAGQGWPKAIAKRRGSALDA